MVRRYDLSYLQPRDLEKLARELIQARERKQDSTLYFQTYAVGRDGGIDFKVSGKNIFGQVKKCSTDFQSFFRRMQLELPKVIKWQPERYFVITDLHLRPEHKEEIVNYFAPYILKDGDVLGRDDLIDLLNDYQIIAERYFPSSLELSAVAKLSVVEEEKARREKELFFKHQRYYSALNILSGNSILVITGAPGIGKSILGRAVGYHYLENEDYDDFYKITNVNHALHNFRLGRKQIFFMDDILGDIIYKNTEAELLEFIDHIKDATGVKLIITTRKYILDYARIKFGKWHLERFKHVVDILDSCVINLRKYTQVEKKHILFNLIKCSKLPIGITKYLATPESFHDITDKHFSPRIVEDFFEINANTTLSGYWFLELLKKTLKNPYKYWLDIFNGQKESYKIVSLILLVSNAPMLYADLLDSFKEVCKHMTLCEKGYEAEELNRALEELSELFLSTIVMDRTKIIEFNNSSIKDFLLQFLRTDGEHYIEHLIQGAYFYNQLFFVFTTKMNEGIYDEKELDEDGYKVFMMGQKITLDERHSNLMLNKILKDFHTLGYSELKRISAFSGKVYEKRRSKDLLAYKLSELIDEFDPKTYYKVNDFVGQQLNEIFFWKNKKMQYIGEQNMLYIPRVLKKVKPYLKLDGNKVVSSYFNSIRSLNELYEFESLEDVFPTEFALFLINNAQFVQRKVRLILENTASFFASDRLGKYLTDASLFIDQDIDIFVEYYGLELDDEFRDELEFQVQGYLDNDPGQRKKVKEPAHIPMRPPRYKQLLPKKPEDFSTEQAIEYFLVITADNMKEYVNQLKNDPMFTPFLVSKRSVELLAGCAKAFTPEVVFKSEFNLYIKYFNYVVHTFHGKTNIPIDEYLRGLLLSVIMPLNKEARYIRLSIIRTSVNSFCSKYGLDATEMVNAILDVDFLFEKNRDWYSFSIPALIPFTFGLILGVLDGPEKSKIYKSYIQKKMGANVHVPAFWKFSYMFDRPFFVREILLKELVNFSSYLDRNSSGNDLHSLLCYLDIKIYFKRTGRPETRAFEIWKIKTKKQEALYALNFLGIKTDFTLLNNWFKSALLSTGERKKEHDSVIDYIESFADDDSFSPEPSPYDDRFTSYRIFQLQRSMEHEVFFNVIKNTVFAGIGEDLVSFCRNKKVELQQELNR